MAELRFHVPRGVIIQQWISALRAPYADLMDEHKIVKSALVYATDANDPLHGRIAEIEKALPHAAHQYNAVLNYIPRRYTPNGRKIAPPVLKSMGLIEVDEGFWVCSNGEVLSMAEIEQRVGQRVFENFLVSQVSEVQEIDRTLRIEDYIKACRELWGRQYDNDKRIPDGFFSASEVVASVMPKNGYTIQPEIINGWILNRANAEIMQRQIHWWVSGMEGACPQETVPAPIPLPQMGCRSWILVLIIGPTIVGSIVYSISHSEALTWIAVILFFPINLMLLRKASQTKLW